MSLMPEAQSAYWSREPADLTRELGSGPGGLSVSFVPLPLSIAAAAVGIVCAYVLSTEVVKAWFFRHRDG